MRDDTSNPRRASSSASFVDDFDVHRSNDIGLPRVSGWTSSSSASSRPGCLSINGLSPPPGARNRSDGSIPAATSASALITVLRLIPDAVATAVLPPRPSISAAAPAHTPLHLIHVRQRDQESRERLRVTSTPSQYYARTNLAWTLTLCRCTLGSRDLRPWTSRSPRTSMVWAGSWCASWRDPRFR